MATTISVRIDDDMNTQLEKLSIQTGRPKSELLRDAIKRQLAVNEFQILRQKMMAEGESKGLLVDEDVFREVS